MKKATTPDCHHLHFFSNPRPSTKSKNSFISEWILRLRSLLRRRFESRAHFLEAYGERKLPSRSPRRQPKRTVRLFFTRFVCLFFSSESLLPSIRNEIRTKQRSSSPAINTDASTSSPLYVGALRDECAPTGGTVYQRLRKIGSTGGIG